MYNNTLYQGEKHFCRYYLQAFSTEEVLKGYIKDSFKINGKQRIVVKKGEYVKFKNYERKIKLPFIIHADFESILVPENNGKQNPEDPYTNKYQRHILLVVMAINKVCVDDKSSKSSLLLVMTKKTVKISRTLLNVGSMTMIMLIMMLK